MLDALLALLLAATLPPQGAFGVDSAASTIQYTIVHKLHRVAGTSHEVEAKAILKDDGSLLTMVRVPVASFRSGDANRDEHMLEAMDAGKFPYVVFKGIARLGSTHDLPSGPLPLNGELELHGVKTPLMVPVTVLQRPDGSLRARGSFGVSLDAHHVERPSLLFVKVDDDCHIDFDLVMREGR
jgi:polyisoprenoid-binding protein YceI